MSLLLVENVDVTGVESIGPVDGGNTNAIQNAAKGYISAAPLRFSCGILGGMSLDPRIAS